MWPPRFRSWSPSSTQLRLDRALKARSTQSQAWGPKVKTVSSVTPRILGVLLNGAIALPISTRGWSRKWRVSGWISEGQWPVACHLPTSPKRSIVGLPFPQTPRCWEQRPAMWSRQRSKSGMGQSDTKCLKRAGEMISDAKKKKKKSVF